MRINQVLYRTLQFSANLLEAAMMSDNIHMKTTDKTHHKLYILQEAHSIYFYTGDRNILMYWTLPPSYCLSDCKYKEVCYKTIENLNKKSIIQWRRLQKHIYVKLVWALVKGTIPTKVCHTHFNVKWTLLKAFSVWLKGKLSKCE